MKIARANRIRQLCRKLMRENCAGNLCATLFGRKKSQMNFSFGEVSIANISFSNISVTNTSLAKPLAFHKALSRSMSAFTQHKFFQTAFPHPLPGHSCHHPLPPTPF
jgi:hypothetical protein